MIAADRLHLPDWAVSETFLEQLAGATDEEAAWALVEDRRALVAATRPGDEILLVHVPRDPTPEGLQTMVDLLVADRLEIVATHELWWEPGKVPADWPWAEDADGEEWRGERVQRGWTILAQPRTVPPQGRTT